MIRLLLVIFIAAAIVMLMTYLLGKLFKHTRWVKYVIGIMAIVVSLYLFYMSRQPSKGFEGLGQFIMALIFFPAGIIGIMTAFIMDSKK
ncbi:hypothetical protein [Lutispora thermophila]|uniref:YesK-like protein n=1 Tax=Lutispora thermophila DSM 19022 TaxID=1122184 RepID=A0A1M6B7L9_9FIRM|nr:hypothetical protein [Lutispora thermophila]SHI44744.1 hypothetical protein SAMN02745176_00316 [Lutispora thermophila DSM 19022]